MRKIKFLIVFLFLLHSFCLAFGQAQTQEIKQTEYNQKKLDPKFKDNYKGKEFDYHREIKPKKSTEVKPAVFNLNFQISNILMYILLTIIVFAVIFYVIKNSGGFSFVSGKNKIKVGSGVEQVFEDGDNIDNNDFQSLIQKAKSENNYRLAIRYYFLWVLQSLSDKNLIRWNKDKTNYDYFVELGKHPIQDDFFKNIHLYDYIWYGNFELNNNEFKTAESIFQKTLKKLK